MLQVREVRAAEDYVVRARRDQRLYLRADDLLEPCEPRPLEFGDGKSSEPLDLRDELVRHRRDDRDVLRELAPRLVVEATVEGPLCREDRYDAGPGLQRSGLHRGFESDERNVGMFPPEYVYRGGGRSVACDDDHLASLGQELGRVLLREADYLVRAPVAVRTVLGVGEVYGPFVRTQFPERAEDARPADA